MSHEFVARRLDVKAFAQAEGTLSGRDLLSKYERLSLEADGRAGGRVVEWTARGELRPGPGGFTQVWLHLQVRATLSLICQRCLEPADIEVVVDHSFRFVATEAQAQAEDEEAEEDVLVLSRDLDLQELIEDELLMALPLVPRHEVCPTEVRLSAQDDDFEAASAAQPKPFAALAGLKDGKTG